MIRSLKPDIIILETGANDGLRGVDPQVLEKNLDEIVTIIKANGIDILLAGMKIPPNLGTDPHRPLCKRLSKNCRQTPDSLDSFFSGKRGR